MWRPSERIRWNLGSYPERLAQVRGISAKKAAAIGESYSQLSGLRELMVFLEAHGVSSGYAARLQASYGATAITRIKENPYSLAEDITGIGFKTADRIAMAMGMEHDCEARLRAGIAYALTQPQAWDTPACRRSCWCVKRREHWR